MSITLSRLHYRESISFDKANTVTMSIVCEHADFGETLSHALKDIDFV